MGYYKIGYRTLSVFSVKNGFSSKQFPGRPMPFTMSLNPMLLITDYDKLQ